MQIRERSTTWALIRTTYDKTRKRGVAKCLGTIPKRMAVLSPELAQELREDERIQIEKVLRDARFRRELEKRERYALTLPSILELVARWYDSPMNSSRNLESLARETREEFTKLLAAMVRAGVGRTRKRAVRKTSR